MFLLYQIIVSQWGLSLGEIETINNLFKDYDNSENPINQNVGYASTLEIEFVKNKDTDFFDCIPIEKWTDLVEVIKNIKKRRGRKGLKLKIIITDYFESGEANDINVHIKNSDDVDNEGKIELLFFKRTIFLLVHKIDSEFIKGLERIEVAIENFTELFKKLTQSSVSEDRYKKDTYEYDKAKFHHSLYDDYHGTISNRKNEIQMQIFLFDDKKRVWKVL
ncbi:hypothetical protein [Candidatus Nitrosocosmicus arcticus]|uniref:Uncharacterized protein n=1 Tax=Candidatus Nitrosocosmicus arcticus TaxID=2035267 RepID=A0A557SXY0_9ARCH|nr:hypothetical protein [Candidatus Nitrosocosmicus arcticus]TVP41455.1 hypothetical protein NARC_30170 [Candidatus Nitrosocosmicus arcticus]